MSETREYRNYVDLVSRDNNGRGPGRDNGNHNGSGNGSVKGNGKGKGKGPGAFSFSRRPLLEIGNLL